MIEHYPVVIAGSGCAGHTAAIYAARADLRPLVLEGQEPGGQLSLTSDVENFPGFPEGMNGYDLVENMKKQAQRFGSTYQYGSIAKVEHNQGPPFTITLDDGKVVTCSALIIATGARARRLGVPGEAELFGKGVSSCATCDGAFFRNVEIAVVGGGDSAMEEALFLTRFASKVKLIHRRDTFRASKIMIDRVQAHPKIEIAYNSRIAKIEGTPEKGVQSIQLVANDGAITDWPCAAVFLGIGHIPNTEFLRGVVELDEEGYITTLLGKTNGENVLTKVPGLFAAGDVADRHYRQAITAAGMGCKAAMDAELFLAEHTTKDESGTLHPAYHA
jgi:thioredoxin reductase (NADPH)